MYFIKIPSCAQALDSLHPTGKISPPNSYPLPLAKQQFSYYNTIKNSFLAVVVVPVPGHTNFGVTDVQYLQNGVFSIENSLNGQKHSLKDFHHPMKKSLPSPKFPIPPLGWCFPLPLYCYLENSCIFLTFQLRGVEITFTHFFSLTLNWGSV